MLFPSLNFLFPCPNEQEVVTKRKHFSPFEFVLVEKVARTRVPLEWHGPDRGELRLVETGHVHFHGFSRHVTHAEEYASFWFRFISREKRSVAACGRALSGHYMALARQAASALADHSLQHPPQRRSVGARLPKIPSELTSG